jgi:hypothetical protein
MTDQERRIVLSTLRIAASLLIAGGCDHNAVLPAYRTTLAEAWGIDDSAVERVQEFQQLVHEMNTTIATKYPDAIKPPEGQLKACSTTQLI